MQEARFTEGPWVVALPRNDRVSVIPEAHRSRRIGGSSDPDEDRDEFAREVCACSKDRHGRDSHLANAYLIAAAPALLKAAKRALAVLKAQGNTPQRGDVLDALSAAIAAASPQ